MARWVAWILIPLVAVASTVRADDAPWTVHVVNLGWHTGIAVRVEEIDPFVIPETADFQNAAWIEFGWGDRDFYRNPDPDVSTYFSAVFEDTPAVMHLVALGVHPRRYFGDSVEVLAVPLSRAEHRRLQAFLTDSFDRAGTRRARPIERGLYRASLFYDAVGVFNLSNTCNTWVARAFAATGLPVDTDLNRASTVMRRLRKALSIRPLDGSRSGESSPSHESALP